MTPKTRTIIFGAWAFWIIACVAFSEDAGEVYVKALAVPGLALLALWFTQGVLRIVWSAVRAFRPAETTRTKHDPRSRRSSLRRRTT
jgi:hypothetical protein